MWDVTGWVFLLGSCNHRNKELKGKDTEVLFAYTPREGRAKVRADRGLDLLGGRLICCILVRSGIFD